MSCPGATLHRNYFADGGQCGGSARQINTVRDVEAHVRNSERGFWTMSNGYLLPTKEDGSAAFKRLGKDIRDSPELAADLIGKVRVGVNWNTPIAANGNEKKKKAEKKEKKLVCQVWASACPMQYCKYVSTKDWEGVAKTVLFGMYEATILCALKLSREGGGRRVKVFLTLVGGGAFGNPMSWIHEAIERAVLKHKNEPLDVRLVHYSPVAKGSVQDVFEKALRKRLP